MGLFDVLSKKFMGKEKGTEGKKRVEQQPVDFSGLLSSVDAAISMLNASELENDRIAAYAEKLNDIKKELSGLTDAKAIPELPGSMKRAIERAMPKAFKYGDSGQVNAVMDSVFAGVRALNGTEKTQIIATLDIQIQVMTCEGVEGKHFYDILVKDSDAAYQRMRENTQRELHEALNAKYSYYEQQVRAQRDKNREIDDEVEKLIRKKRNVETDTAGEDFFAVVAEIKEFEKMLPSIEDQVIAVQEIRKMQDENLASLKSETEMLKRALGPEPMLLEEEMPRTSEQTGNAQEAKNQTVRTAEKAEQAQAAEE